jgi:ubiquinone/menaquinone biosynthesis C-methylase UbiE
MRLLQITSLALLGAVAFAQQFKNPNNLGPDMPTPQPVVEMMLKAAKVKPGEVVYDLGCGDGRIVITAAQEYDAKGVGIEMSRDIFDKTEARVKSLGLQDKVQVIHGNALHVDLSPADVVTLYLLTSSNERLKPSLAKLHPGARVVSHDFQIRGWVPTSVQKVTVMGMVHTVYLYEIKPKG